MNNQKTNHQKSNRKPSEAGGRVPATESPAPPDVFRYDDYRAFLWERFVGLQARDPAFSQRGLARKAGIANPGFFNEVIKGRRRLSPAAARKMAQGLELSEEESEFFSALVEYAETREPGAKLEAGKRLIDMRNRKFPGADGGRAPADGAGRPADTTRNSPPKEP